MNAPVEKFPATVAGYKTFELGAFTFARDEYFATITWPVQGGRRQSHTISADAFLRLTVEDLLPARLRTGHVAKRQAFANGGMGDLLKMANWRTGLMAQHQQGHECGQKNTEPQAQHIGQHDAAAAADCQNAGRQGS